MKTVEELNTLREEFEALNRKLAELSDEELAQVSGGAYINKYNQSTGGIYAGGLDDQYTGISYVEPYNEYKTTSH